MSAELVLGRYVRLSEPAPLEGGMSTVTCCIETTAGQRVALKVLKAQPDTDHLEEEIFHRELNVEELDHPNIIRLIESGRLPDTGQFYLVFDWAETDLGTWAEENRPLLPDDFIESVGLPLLRALSHAHERDVVHRDVKPSNVLIRADGSPLLADFGISRMKSKLVDSGLTVRDFVSRPFSPPEGDHMSTYSRDVFSFGALLLWCLSDIPVNDYTDFADALDDIDVAPELSTLICDCVQLEEANRPRTASEVLFRLEQMQAARRKVWQPTQTLHISVPSKVAGKLATSAGIGRTHVEELIKREMDDPPAVRYLPPNADRPRTPSERHYFVYGTTWRFHVAVDLDTSACVLIGAQDVGAGECESYRDRNLILDNFLFVVASASNKATASAVVRSFCDRVEEFDANRSEENAHREELRLFSEWRSQLDAREAHDRRTGDSLRFKSMTISGMRVTVKLKDEPSSELADQRRRIIADDGTPIGAGLVEEVVGDLVTIYLGREARRAAQSGQLLIDRSAEGAKLWRERSALDEVRRQSPAVLRSALANLIVHPEDVAPPRPIEPSNVEWQQQLDESKQRAVLAALGSDDFLVVEGPPGTGKTTFIAELIVQTLRRDPSSRILLASQTHVALDNAIERLLSVFEDATVLRIGNPNSGKIAESSSKLTVDHQLMKWRQKIAKRSERFLERFAQRSGTPLEDVRRSIGLRSAARIGDEIALADAQAAERRARLDRSVLNDEADDDRLSLEQVEDLQSEIQTLQARVKELNSELRVYRNDRAIGAQVKEALSSGSWGELRSAADRILQAAGEADHLVALVDIQADWIQRAGRGDDFKTALLQSSQVVGATCIGLAQFPSIGDAEFDLCIVDEASKATATETLVPLLRARSWVLVGDDKQLPPFREEALTDHGLIAEFGLDPEEIGRSLFSRMSHALPEANCLELSRQFRMVDEIGDLISECFYSGKVDSAGVRPPAWARGIQPRPVIWYSTEGLRDRQDRRSPHSPSYLNLCEVTHVIRHLKRMELLLRSQRLDQPVSVLVVAPYTSQVHALQRAVSNEQWSSDCLSIEVNTVDAVQGREADVVVFSTTRSNSSRSLGFVKDLRRSNVALSRGRFLLTIIGDAHMFDDPSTPLGEVLGHIRTHPDACAIEDLEA